MQATGSILRTVMYAARYHQRNSSQSKFRMTFGSNDSRGGLVRLAEEEGSLSMLSADMECMLLSRSEEAEEEDGGEVRVHETI